MGSTARDTAWNPSLHSQEKPAGKMMGIDKKFQGVGVIRKHVKNSHGLRHNSSNKILNQKLHYGNVVNTPIGNAAI